MTGACDKRNELMESFARLLGPKREAAFLTLDARQVEKALGQFGLPQRTVTFRHDPSASSGRPYSMEEWSGLPHERITRNEDFRTLDDLADRAGTITRLLPADF